jgi:hypothetical protein
MKLSLRSMAIAVVAIWSVVPLIGFLLLPAWPERGQFGDIFGSVNALFSGLAFAGLFWALEMQREQLELQRNELILQREELRLQREEMAASRAELANQVRAQQALFRASAAQIRVASVQARIDAAVLHAESIGAGGRERFVKQIEAHADALESLSNQILVTD